MSSDNAVVVLKLSDQFRVKHAGALDNLYWSYGLNSPSDEILPHRVFEYFKDAKKFESADEAMLQAIKTYEKTGLVEYGIVELEINKTWSAILKKARTLVAEEKLFVLGSDMSTEMKNEIVDRLNYTYGDILKEVVKNGETK